MRRFAGFGWIVCALLLLLAGPASADNGEVAFAYPAAGIEIDGDLSDWPESARPYPIERIQGNAPNGSTDFDADFRAAYDAEKKLLFVAVEVRDDSHTINEEEGAGWTSQDSYLLYVDPVHDPGRSAPILFQAGEKYRELTLAPLRPEPTELPRSWDDVEVAVRREGNRTLYEWRLQMGDGLTAGRTIGLDHLLYDEDENGEGGTYFHWGRQLGKSSNAGRLGDLVLLPEDASLGFARGYLVWDGPVEAELPRRIRLRSSENPNVWVDASVDQGGRFQLSLPADTYDIELVYSIASPFSGWGDPQGRVALKEAAGLEVQANQINDAGTLQVVHHRAPDYLIPEQGVLATFDGNNPKHVADLTHFTEAFRRYYDIPGATLALVKDGEIVYHETFGVQNTLTGEPVNKDTLYEAASISKSMFAYAFMRLVERGLIDLDRPLHEVLPFDNIADDPRSKLITARHVLTHQAGMGNWPFGGPGSYANGQKGELNYTPGEDYSYSGTMINYLGRVAEKLTGKTIEEIVAEETFATMGMTDTAFTENENFTRRAMGHWHRMPNFNGHPSYASMASSAHTNPGELARFMIGLMEGRGLKPETHAEMWKRQLELPRDDDDEDPRWTGLGFFWQETGVGSAVGHGGNNGDFKCEMLMVPEINAGWTVMTNNNVGHQLMAALQAYLMGEPGD